MNPNSRNQNSKLRNGPRRPQTARRPQIGGGNARQHYERYLARARDLPEEQLPVRSPRTDGPPTPRAWAERDPVAAERLTLARDGMNRLSEEHQVPAENLLTPDTVRRLMWAPAGSDLTAIGDQLRRLGAREWQIELAAPTLLEAVVSASGSAPAGSPQPVD